MRVRSEGKRVRESPVDTKLREEREAGADPAARAKIPLKDSPQPVKRTKVKDIFPCRPWRTLC